MVNYFLIDLELNIFKINFKILFFPDIHCYDINQINRKKAMFDIIHQIGVKSKPENIYQLLTTDEGLSQWWTKDTQGAGDIGSMIEFKFNEIGLQFEVSKLIANKKVVWKHKGSVPEAWMGTEIVFNLIEEDKQTLVRFNHQNWSQSSDFMAHCCTKWAVFLLSLKDAVEKGEGNPFPNDVQIDHS
jgi:uncharacterized protein YndB with AHSA1/START domain